MQALGIELTLERPKHTEYKRDCGEVFVAIQVEISGRTVSSTLLIHTVLHPVLLES